MGPRPTRPLPGRRSCVLLQTMGRADAEGWWTRARRAHLGRAALGERELRTAGLVERLRLIEERRPRELLSRPRPNTLEAVVHDFLAGTAVGGEDQEVLAATFERDASIQNRPVP